MPPFRRDNQKQPGSLFQPVIFKKWGSSGSLHLAFLLLGSGLKRLREKRALLAVPGAPEPRHSFTNHEIAGNDASYPG